MIPGISSKKGSYILLKLGPNTKVNNHFPVIAKIASTKAKAVTNNLDSCISFPIISFLPLATTGKITLAILAGIIKNTCTVFDTWI